MSNEKFDQQKRAEHLIAGLGETVGLDSVALDENGQCYLSFDDLPVLIGYDKDAGWIYLECKVLDVPTSPARDFYGWVLEDNYRSFSNGIGCLALDRELNGIVWLDRRPVGHMDQRQFETWLAESLDRAEFWSRELSTRANSAQLSTSDQYEEATPLDQMVFRP